MWLIPSGLENVAFCQKNCPKLFINPNLEHGKLKNYVISAKIGILKQFLEEY